MTYSKEWLTVLEWKRLASLRLDSRDRVMLCLLYECALRVSELCNLKVKDIDFSEKNVIIRKSKHEPNPRVVPLISKDVIKVLHDYIAENRLTAESLVMPLHRKTIYERCQILARAARIRKKIGTHIFRRSRATHLLNSGLAIQWVQQLLRHKNIKTTQEYLLLTSDQLRKEMEKVEEAR